MEKTEKIIRRFSPSSYKKKFTKLFSSRDALVITTKRVWLRKWIPGFDVSLPLKEIGHVVVIERENAERLYITERADDDAGRSRPPRLTCDWLDDAREVKLLIDATRTKYAGQ